MSKANERAKKLAQMHLRKHSFDLASVQNTLANSLGAIRDSASNGFNGLSGNQQQILRNAAIGAGVGGLGSLASSRRGYRAGDTLRGAIAGGLLGGGGTAAVQAARGDFASLPSQGDGDVPPALPSSGDDEPGLLSPITNRPLTSLMAGSAAINEADNFIQQRSNKSYASHWRSPFHEFGISEETLNKDNPITNFIRKYVLGGDRHRVQQDRIADNLRAHAATLEDGPRRKAYLDIAEGPRSALPDLARDVGRAVDTGKLQSRDAARLYDRINSLFQDNNAPIKGSLGDWDRVLNSKPGPTGKGRLQMLGLLGGSALIEPTVWSGLGSLMQGDADSQRLTADQINAINEKYFR